RRGDRSRPLVENTAHRGQKVETAMQIFLYSLVAVLLTIGGGFGVTHQWQAPGLAPRGQTVETGMSTLPSGSAQTVPAGDDTALRPFRVQIPDEALLDLRRRVAATRWPESETVPDRSQGVQLAAFQELVRYWGTDYDWRKVEARLNALPQFMTTI